MKIRSGFVSNSSSSSFICEVCGNIESGYDLSFSDREMCECENGHILDNSHVITAAKVEREDLDYFEINKEACPICMMSKITEDDQLRYCCKLLGLSLADLQNQISCRFNSFDELQKFLEG